MLGALLAPLLRRRIFSRNTKSATEALKQFMEGLGLRLTDLGQEQLSPQDAQLPVEVG